MSKYIPGLVSVIIPTYKRCDTLVRAIESVINQTYKNIEIIVVNDNTPNDEFSLRLYDEIKKITDERLIFVEQEKHINGAAARNCGIKIAKGEYLAFLDDDDYWMPQKIEHHLAAFEKLGDEWGVVASLCVRHKNGELVMAAPPYKDGYILHEIMQRTIGLSTIAVLIRRGALDDVGYFDENLIRHQDIQLFTCLAYKYKVYLLKEYLQVINVDDTRNRPSSERVAEIKEAYYVSVGDILSKLTRKETEKIYIMNRFECAALLFHEKKYKQFTKDVIRIFRYPSTLFYSVQRIMKRFEGKILKNYLVNRYKPK